MVTTTMMMMLMMMLMMVRMMLRVRRVRRVQGGMLQRGIDVRRIHHDSSSEIRCEPSTETRCDAANRHWTTRCARA